MTTLISFADDLTSLTDAKTLNQLKKAIELHIESLTVYTVSNACSAIVLISKDDRFYIDIMLDRSNAYMNRVRIFDRQHNVDHGNKNTITGHGYQGLTDYIFELKREKWASA